MNNDIWHHSSDRPQIQNLKNKFKLVNKPKKIKIEAIQASLTEKNIKFQNLNSVATSNKSLSMFHMPFPR